MSDVFYAVQYRNMHTAIHHVAIFSLEDKAKEFHMHIEEEMAQPADDFFEPMNFIIDYGIDHRNPPTHCTEAFDELRLIYVNDTNTFQGTLRERTETIVPDVY